MALTYTNVNATSTNNTVCSAPASTGVGDTLIAHVFNFDTVSADVIGCPAGWVQLGTQISETTASAKQALVAVFARAAVASEPASYTFISPGYTDICIRRYTGSNPYTPVVAAGTHGSSATATAKGLTTTVANETVVTGIGLGGGGFALTADPSGWGNAVVWDVNEQTYDQIVVSPGAMADQTAGITPGSDGWTSLTVTATAPTGVFIQSAISTTAVTSVVLTPSVAVPTGATLVIAVCLSAAGTVSAVDTAALGSNTYTKLTTPDSTNTVRLVVLVANNVHALTTSNTITITIPSSRHATLAYYWPGMTASAVDVAPAATTGTGTAATLPASGTLAQASELVLGIVAQALNGTTWVPGTSFVGYPARSNANSTNPRTIAIEEQIVSATTTLTPTATIGAVAYVGGTVSLKLAATVATSTRTVPQTATLLATTSRPVPQTAVLLATATRPVPQTAALGTTLTRTITPQTAVLSATLTRTVLQTAVLLAVGTRTVSETAVVLLSPAGTRTVPQTGVLGLTSTRTVPQTAALGLTGTRSVPQTAVLLATATHTVPQTAVLLATSTRVVPETAVLLATSARSVPEAVVLLLSPAGISTVPQTAAVGLTSTRTVSQTGTLGVTLTRTVPQTALVGATVSRPVPQAAILLATVSRTVPHTSMLLATAQRTVPQTLALSLTSTRSVPQTAVLGVTSSRLVPQTATVSATAQRSVPQAVLVGGAGGVRLVPQTAVLLAKTQATVPQTAALVQSSTRTITPQAAALGLTTTQTVPQSAVTAATLTAIVSQTAVLLFPATPPSLHKPVWRGVCLPLLTERGVCLPLLAVRGRAISTG